MNTKKVIEKIKDNPESFYYWLGILLLPICFLVILLLNLACMTSAMVVESPRAEVSPTVTVSDYPANVETREEVLPTWSPRSYVVCTDALHVRSGPRVEASVKDYLYRGDVVIVSEVWEGWGMIDVARWVRLKYLC